MTWNAIRPVLADLLLMHARLERIRLVDKLQAAEVHLRAVGLDVEHLQTVRRTLLTRPVAREGPMFPVPTPPPPIQADGTQRLRYLQVSGR